MSPRLQCRCCDKAHKTAANRVLHLSVVRSHSTCSRTTIECRPLGHLRQAWWHVVWKNTLPCFPIARGRAILSLGEGQCQGWRRRAKPWWRELSLVWCRQARKRTKKCPIVKKCRRGRKGLQKCLQLLISADKCLNVSMSVDKCRQGLKRFHECRQVSMSVVEVSSEPWQGDGLTQTPQETWASIAVSDL